MKTTKEIHCLCCKEGIYAEIPTSYETTVADDVKVLIPRITLLRCPKCGDELIPPDAQKQIDQAVVEQTEQLSQRDLEDFADIFAEDQKHISEILGLGSKTFHRWINGSQFPSRSMGFYLRVLAEFPEAFEWVKERKWRNRNRVHKNKNLDLALQFPDLASMTKETPTLYGFNQPVFSATEGRRFNPATLFTQIKVI